MWLISIFIILICHLIWKSLRKPHNYPPGPWGLPLIGSLPSSLEDYCIKLTQLREKHNDAISWRIGTKLIVVLFDYNLIKEAFLSPNCAWRPDAKTLTYLQGDQILGIILTKGHHWRTNRRFALKHLRDFGMGKPKLLQVAHYEADCFIAELKKQVGRPASVPHALFIAIMNIVWQMVGSKRYDFDDEEANSFCKLISDTQIYGSKLAVLDVLPWIKKVAPQFILNKYFQLHAQKELSDQIKLRFRKHIDEHLEDLDSTNIRDYIDAYLVEMEKQKSNPDSQLSIEDLIFCMSDLFEGASETTDLTLHWTILYLAKSPHVQNKLQEEIDQILPNGTVFEMDHKSKLPYTEAFIHEVLRFSSVSAQPPRAALADTKIGNYFIPEGAFIIYQTSLLHNDSRYFDSPSEFRPERFLDSEGKFTTPKEGFLPFGLGNRVCIGEAIARMELFVFITKFAQTFSFEFPPGEESDLEGVVGPFFRPPKGAPNVIINLRHKYDLNQNDRSAHVENDVSSTIEFR